MKRILLLALLLALSALAAPAQAKGPDSTRAYWTDERMRDARPVDRGRAGLPQTQARKPGGGTSTSWSTTQVPWPSTTALDAHGKVFFTDGVYNYVCSGTAVSATVVWTAGHCVNEGGGEFYDKWMFVPAYNKGGVQKPYGDYTALSLHTTPAWENEMYAYGRDLGAARVDRTIATYRTLDTATTYQVGQRLVSYGYPAEGKYSGRTMYQCDSYVSRFDGNSSPATYGIPCGMNGGSSGGGWVAPDGRVMSVNSYGYQSLKNTMFGPTHAGAAADLFQRASTGN
jgi:V8-like Glu-specific endopeptidase